MNQVNQLNGLALAYMGDAVYEVYIRRYLIEAGITKPNHLHKEATKFVSAKAQAMLIDKMMTIPNFLSEDELTFYKRGRNAKSHTTAKNTDVVTYRVATGFESVMGYLYLTNQIERFEELCRWCVKEVMGE